MAMLGCDSRIVNCNDGAPGALISQRVATYGVHRAWNPSSAAQYQANCFTNCLALKDRYGVLCSTGNYSVVKTD